MVLGTLLLTDLESSIMAGIVVVAALLPWLRRRRGPGLGQAAHLAGVAAAVTAVVASPQLIVMAQQAIAATRPCRRALSRRTTPTPVRRVQQVFAPSPRVGVVGLKSAASYYYSSGPHSATFVAYGVVLTALALFGLVVSWRRRSARLLALFWLGATWLAMGTGILIGRPPICAVPPG